MSKREVGDLFDVSPEAPLSHSFCRACASKDLRALQDRLNVIFVTMTKVADLWGVDGGGMDLVNAVGREAERKIVEERRQAEEAERRRKLRGGAAGKAVRHTKYEKEVKDE